MESSDLKTRFEWIDHGWATSVYEVFDEEGCLNALQLSLIAGYMNLPVLRGASRCRVSLAFCSHNCMYPRTLLGGYSISLLR